MSAVPPRRHLGPFSDLVEAARAQAPLFPLARPGEATRTRARALLAFRAGDETPADLRVERTWRADGVDGEEISWSVGYGPRTHAFVLKPSGATGPLPGVLALHDHSHIKLYGKEKIADGPEGPLPALEPLRRASYGGRPYANALARAGFVVLAPDVFLFGSRRFPLDAMPEFDRRLAGAVEAAIDPEARMGDAEHYDGAAVLNEHVAAKYCTLLGTSLAAVVAAEDRVALAALAARPEVDPGRLGCIGLSGGGLRASLLRATSDRLAASAIVGMMTTCEGLLDGCVATHTWMLFPPGLSRLGDWPDLAASAAPAPLLVQYLIDDALFTIEGMRGADARLAAHYAGVGAREAYRGEFFPGPHRFDVPMQDSAIAWLAATLRA